MVNCLGSANSVLAPKPLPFLTLYCTSMNILQTCLGTIGFVSKQPKLEPKLVSALSETRRLFQLIRFNIKTGSFDVLKQPKQTKDQPKQPEFVKI